MRIPLAIAASTVLALSLTACGDDSDDKKGGNADSFADASPETIKSEVEDAMKDLETVHLKGTITDDGETYVVDVTTSQAGDCTGNMSMPGSGSFELLVADGQSYFKADETFWESTAGEGAGQIMQMVGDKWVTDSTDPEGFGELCDLDQLLDEMFSDDDEDEDEMKVEGTDEVDGIETLKLSFTSDDGNEGEVHVALEEPHYLIEMGAEDEGSLTFSEFNTPLEVSKPASGEVVDFGTM